MSYMTLSRLEVRENYLENVADEMGGRLYGDVERSAPDA